MSSITEVDRSLMLWVSEIRMWMKSKDILDFIDVTDFSDNNSLHENVWEGMALVVLRDLQQYR